MSDQHQREVAVFEAALQLPPEQREAYLERTCAGDADLLQRIRALLKAEESQTDFLAPASPAASLPLSEQPGDRIGPYKLLQQIGEGGCGVVYMAEQEQPIRRRVALKVIKLGMDTRQVVARFEAERQALALMDHPNIAKVHDAGATETGRPYFVMELVRGIRITDYCDEKKLSTRERLELFIQVCQAVQHAHQKGIIHRDLKPSNILVTVNDGVAVPKVIDFGIAKATTGERLTDKTVFTAFEQFIGTPAYMSPEQAEFTSVDIDTRSDIYSLGVLLYELLTGQTPFDAKELLQAGLDEMRRTLREKAPAKPSTRLRTLGAEELTTAAHRRGLESPKLVNLVRGDLDWIVMKCLEKDRARRYATANGLASDIQRHLSNEPVVARPPSRLYEFQKTVRRHKVGFATTGVVILALLFGLGISVWALVKERQARQHAVAAETKAKAEAGRSQQVAQFLNSLLERMSPQATHGDATMIRWVLDSTTERLGRELVEQPDMQAELRSTLVGLYLDIGEYAKAENLARMALESRRSLFGPNDPATARSLGNLSRVLWREGRLAEAENAVREAVGIQRQFQKGVNPDLVESLDTLAAVVWREGKLAEGEELERQTLALRKSLGQGAPVVPLSLDGLAAMLWSQGKLDEAETLATAALAMLTNFYGADHEDVSVALNNLGIILRDKQELAEAETRLRGALAMRRKLFGNHHPLVVNSLDNLADVLERRGKLDDADGVIRECLEICDKSFPEHWYGFSARSRLGANLLARKEFDEAEPLLLSGYAGMRQREERIAVDSKVRLKEALESLVQLYEQTNRPEKVARWKRELIAWGGCVADRGDVRALNDLAWCLATSADPTLRDATNAVVFAQKAVAITYRKNAAYLGTLAAAYAEAGDFAKAVSVQEEAMVLLRSERDRKDYASRLSLYQMNTPYREPRA